MEPGKSVDTFEQPRVASATKGLLLRGAAIFVTGSLLLSGDAVAGRGQNNDNLGCVEPTSDAIDEVAALLAEPASDYNVLTQEEGMKRQVESDFTGAHTEKALIDIMAFHANSLGLKTYDYLEAVIPLREAEYDSSTNNTNLPFSTYFTAAEGFLNNYGVTLSTQDDKYELGPTERIPSIKELESISTKGKLSDIIESFGLVPAELIEYAGLEKVILVYDEETDSAAYVDPSQPSYYVVNLASTWFPRDVFAHELFHLIDIKQCGSEQAYLDPEFRSLNPYEIYEDERPDTDSVITDDDTSSLAEPLFASREEARTAGDEDLYCQIDDDIAVIYASSVAPTRYSLTNPLEDKAETFAEMLDTPLQDDGYADFIDEHSPVIRKKSLYLLSRLHSEYPELAEFFIRINAQWWEDDYKPQFICE